jgi:hypothetical protein
MSAPIRKCQCCGDEAEVFIKDDHNRDVCETCREEMVEWACISCNHEFRGFDGDACPRCGHDPNNLAENSQNCDGCNAHREGPDWCWECVEDDEGNERVLCDTCYEAAGRPNDEDE